MDLNEFNYSSIGPILLSALYRYIFSKNTAQYPIKICCTRTVRYGMQNQGYVILAAKTFLHKGHKKRKKLFFLAAFYSYVKFSH
jgi:hypothetical protein